MSSPLARLAAAMDARRLDLGLTWDEVSAESGVHRETIRNLRNRETGSVRGLTKRGLEKALHWRTGSIDMILAGGEPTPLETAEPKRPADKIAELLTEIRQLAQRAAEIEAERRETDSAHRDEEAG